MEELTYEQFINNIITTRGRHGCGEIYHERHHIVPKCIGGSNDELNLIDLFAKEHYEAHRLLALENPHEQGLQFAWWCISSMKNERAKGHYICTPEEFEEARIAMAKASKNKKVPRGKDNPLYGIPRTEETRKRIKEHHPDFSNENHPRCKPVICVETGERFWGAKGAKEKTGVNSSHIIACCKGKRKTAGKLHWRYAEED